MGTLLVAYDIPDDGRRGKVARSLKRFGRRVQYSVFLLHRGTIAEVTGEIQALIDPSEDDVRIHPLCAACEAKAVLLGRAGLAADTRSFRVV